MLSIAFARKPPCPDRGRLALLVPEGAAPAGLAAEAGPACGGALTRALAAAKFTGKKGSSCTMLAPGGGLTRVVAVGLGKAEELTPFGVEEAGGAAAAALAGEAAAAVDTGALPPEHAAAAAMGAVLRAYRFDRYRTKEKPEDKPKLATLTVLCADPAAAARRLGAAGGGGGRRAPGPRPGERAAQRAVPGGDGRPLPGTARSSASRSRCSARRRWTSSASAC